MPLTNSPSLSAELPTAGGELLSARHIGKTYGNARVLNDVAIDIKSRDILALVGENGAGKSTLMKILSGIIAAGDFEGEISICGKTTHSRNVHEAEKQGVVLVPQELRIAPHLSIAENMFVGHLPRNGFGLVDFENLNAQAERWLSVFDMHLDPTDQMGKYSTAEQRMMMIAGALSKDARVLLLDEPTAALTDSETQQLFTHVLRLRQSGLGIVLITHRLDEVEQIADRVDVLRNGILVDRLNSAKGRRGEIVRAMIGRDVEITNNRKGHTPGECVLAVRDVYVEDPDVKGKFRVDGLELTLQRGEIHGLYGLIGAGRTEFARALYGDWNGPVTGTFEILGQAGPPKSPRDALNRGIALLTEDRKATGILDGHSISTNLSAASLPGLSFGGVINDHIEHRRNCVMMEKLDIRPADLDYKIELLSGGNQQKVLFGRWLNANPKILILDEPTLGVDVGARFQIYQTIQFLAEQGLAVLMISSDVDEVAAVCDRITVMYKGRRIHEFSETRSRVDLVAAATGGME